MSEDPICIKVVIVGDGSVGKTSILLTYTENVFPTVYQPTVFDNFNKTLEIDGNKVNLSLWDTAGQQQFNRLRPLSYINCDVFLIIFSVVSPSSYLNAKKKWFPQLDEIAPEAIKIFVGNKIDLRSQQIQTKGSNTKKQSKSISTQIASNFLEQQFNCKYMQCSALTQQGLKEIFEYCSRAALKKKIGTKRSNKKKQQQPNCTLCQVM